MGAEAVARGPPPSPSASDAAPSSSGSTATRSGRMPSTPARFNAASTVARGTTVSKTPVYLMPEVTPANVDTYMEHVVTKKDAFIAALPTLIEANLKTGDIANEKS